MLIEQTLYGERNKVEMAIARLKLLAEEHRRIGFLVIVLSDFNAQILRHW